MAGVIIISKSGFNAKTCDDKDKVFDSRLNTFKVAHAASPTSTGSYAHGLDFTPFFLASTKLSSTQYEFVGQSSGAISSYEATFYSDDTNFFYWAACNYFIFYQDTI